jgi:hypothetical protein
VLRLRAAVIHALWERQDGSLLIMPAAVPIDDPHVRFELTRYLEDQVQTAFISGTAQRRVPTTLARLAPGNGRGEYSWRTPGGRRACSPTFHRL